METTIAELAPYIWGWRSYFGFCETPEVLIYLTRWVRLRLRAALWRNGGHHAVAAQLCLRSGSVPASPTHGWQWTRPLVPCSGQSPLRGAFERSLQIVRPCDAGSMNPGATNSNRRVRSRMCGRGRRVTAAPMPI